MKIALIFMSLILPFMVGNAKIEIKLDKYPSSFATIVSESVMSEVYLTSTGKNIYKENITINIKSGEKIIKIHPPTDTGYSPQIFIGNFINNGVNQILLQINNGGSGAFEFYYIYGAKSDEVKKLFDYEKFSNESTFSGTYQNGYLVKISNKKTNQYFDVSDNYNANLIFDKNGNVIQNDFPIYVSAVNSVLPYYNLGLNRYFINVLQRITGGYEANSYGYIQTSLEIEEDENFIVNYGAITNFQFKNQDN